MYLILASSKDSSLKAFSNAMMWVAIPLTLLTLAIVLIREMRTKIPPSDDS